MHSKDENYVLPANMESIYARLVNAPDKTKLYITGSGHVLPRDASRYFGEQLIKYVLEDLVKGGSEIITRATMVKQGKLAPHYNYLREYAGL